MKESNYIYKQDGSAFSELMSFNLEIYFLKV